MTYDKRIEKCIRTVNEFYNCKNTEDDVLEYIYDSLIFLEFIVTLEEEFQIEIPLEKCDKENFISISSIRRLIEEI